MCRTARKLVWVGSDGEDAESPNLSGATATLSAEAFRRAAADMEMDDELAERFVLGGETRLRGVFGETANSEA